MAALFWKWNNQLNTNLKECVLQCKHGFIGNTVYIYVWQRAPQTLKLHWSADKVTYSSRSKVNSHQLYQMSGVALADLGQSYYTNPNLYRSGVLSWEFHLVCCVLNFYHIPFHTHEDQMHPSGQWSLFQLLAMWLIGSASPATTTERPIVSHFTKYNLTNMATYYWYRQTEWSL